MTLETRLREHLAAKAETIAAEPPPVPEAPSRRAPRWRIAAAVAAAAIVVLAIAAAAWLFRATEPAEPATPDLEDLTPTLQGSLLDWTQVQEISPGQVIGLMAVDGDVVMFTSRTFQDDPGPPLRMWRSTPGTAFVPVETDPPAFGAEAMVNQVVWDGERFHAFGGAFTAPPAGAFEMVESVAWSSTDGREWHVQPLVEARTGSPYVVRSAFVIDAAASERGVIVVATLSNSIDWEAYLADTLGDAYVPGSLTMVDFDGNAGIYRLFAGPELVAEAAADQFTNGMRAGDFEVAVLYASPGGEYRRVDALSTRSQMGQLSVQATPSGLFVLDAGGSAARAWFSVDGEEWEPVAAAVAGDPLEVIRAGSWGDLLLSSVSGLPGRTVVASPDGRSWAPISPPLLGPDGFHGAAHALVAGPGGLFVHGTQIQIGSGPLEVVIPKGDYRVLAYPQTREIYVNPAASTEPVLIATFLDRGPSGLPRGFEPGPGGTVRAVHPDTAEVLLELTAAEWAEIDADAQPQTVLARGWYTADGETWGAEDLSEEFGAPGVLHGAVVGDDAVVVLFERDPPPNVSSPIPGSPFEVWVGRAG